MISTPLAYTGCYLWLDASDTSTLFSLSAAFVPGVNGGTSVQVTPAAPLVGGWVDKSPNARMMSNYMGSLATRPTWIPTLSTVRFNGTTTFLTSFFSQVNSPQTSFIVCTPASYNVAGQNHKILTQSTAGTSDTSTNQHSPFTIAGPGSVASTYNGANVASVSSSGLDLYSCVRNATNNSTINYRSGIGVASTASALAFTITCTRLGAGIANGTTGTVNAGSYFTGDIAEVIIYNRELTLAERADVEFYLAAKWTPVLGGIPRAVYAIANKNFDNQDTWIIGNYPSPYNLPLSSDRVYSNTFTVPITSNVQLFRIGNDVPTNASFVAGGSFPILDQANPVKMELFNGAFGGSSTDACITNYLSSAIFTLSGNLLGGNTGTTVQNIIPSTFNLIGNVTGGAASALVVFGYGNTQLSGNVVGGTATLASNTGYGILHNGLGDVYVNGNVTGGGTHGIINNDSGSVYVTNLNKTITGGTVLSSCGIWNNAGGFIYVNCNNIRAAWTSGIANTHAICNNSYGTVFLSGTCIGANDIFAVNNLQGNLFAKGVFLSGSACSLKYESTNQFTGIFSSSNINNHPVWCRKYTFTPTPYQCSVSFPNTLVTNEQLYSSHLDNASWTKTNTTINRTFSLNKITETAVIGNHLCFQAAASRHPIRPLLYTIKLKSINRQYATVYCGDAISNASNGFSILVDLVAGTILSSIVTGNAILSLSSITPVKYANNNDYLMYECTIGGIINPYAGGTTTATINAGVGLCLNDNTALTNGHFQSYLGVAGAANAGLSAFESCLKFMPSILFPYSMNTYAQYASSAYVETSAAIGYGKGIIDPVSYYAPESYVLSYLPPASSVSQGVNYAGVSFLSGVNVAIPEQLSGTMVIPDPKTVAFQTPVGITEGIALLNRDSIDRAWRTPIANLNQNNSLGAKLKNIITLNYARDGIAKLMIGTDLGTLTGSN